MKALEQVDALVDEAITRDLHPHRLLRALDHVDAYTYRTLLGKGWSSLGRPSAQATPLP